MVNKEVVMLSAEDVFVAPGRIRKSVGNLDDLKASIQSKGQLHPIIITKDGTLISGERRLQACRELEVEVMAMYREDLDDSDMLEIEVTENAARLDFTWQESVQAVKQLHDVKVSLYGKAKGTSQGSKGWSFTDTGRVLGRTGESIRLDYRVAEYMKEYPELTGLPKKSDAYKRVRDIAEDAALMELARRSMLESTIIEQVEENGDIVEKETVVANVTQEEIMAMDEFTDEQKTALLDIISEKSHADEIEERKKEYWPHAEKVIAQRFLQGDCFERLKEFDDEFFDVVITDPPYGIDIADTTAENYIGVFDDSAGWVRENIPKLLKECYRVMAPNSHMYMFFAMGDPNLGGSFYDMIVVEATKVGFEVDKIPMIWIKGKFTGKSGDPNKYPARSYESILFMRKGNLPFVTKGQRNIIIEDPVLGTDKIHPTQKPEGLIRDLMNRSCHPGTKVLDPMAGSGAVVALALKRGLRPYGIELDKQYHARGFSMLIEVFKGLAIPQMRSLVNGSDEPTYRHIVREGDHYETE